MARLVHSLCSELAPRMLLGCEHRAEVLAGDRYQHHHAHGQDGVEAVGDGSDQDREDIVCNVHVMQELLGDTELEPDPSAQDRDRGNGSSGRVNEERQLLPAHSARVGDRPHGRTNDEDAAVVVEEHEVSHQHRDDLRSLNGPVQSRQDVPEPSSLTWHTARRPFRAPGLLHCGISPRQDPP
eukprot:758742-Hanusia_phi.AAC.2